MAARDVPRIQTLEIERRHRPIPDSHHLHARVVHPPVLFECVEQHRLAAGKHMRPRVNAAVRRIGNGEPCDALSAAVRAPQRTASPEDDDVVVAPARSSDVVSDADRCPSGQRQRDQLTTGIRDCQGMAVRGVRDSRRVVAPRDFAHRHLIESSPKQHVSGAPTPSVDDLRAVRRHGDRLLSEGHDGLRIRQIECEAGTRRLHRGRRPQP